MATGENLEVQIWACADGSCIGKEEDRSLWNLVYQGKQELATITFDRFKARPRPLSPTFTLK